MTETVGDPGYVLHLPPMTIHRVEALEDSTILRFPLPTFGCSSGSRMTTSRSLMYHP